MFNETNKAKEIEMAVAEIQQPRSNFQLQKFVLGQHGTPEMQYYQTCLELQDIIYKYKLAKINQKKSELKIKKLRETNDELDELEAQEIELDLANTRFAVIGAERELNYLIEIWDSFAKKYTRKEIELGQANYWETRLTNNVEAMIMGGSSVDYAHIEAMKQAGVLTNFLKQLEQQKKELK